MKLQLKVNNFKDLGNPFGNTKQKTVYVYVNVKDLPSNLPLGPNPREQNMKTTVAKKIVTGLLEEMEIFHALNRGLVLHVRDIKFLPSKSEVIIDLPEDNMYGVMDGGHSYKAILDYRHQLKKDQDQFVKIEVITGAEEFFEKLAASRNTSVQVTDSTIAELEKRYDFIKDALAKQPYIERVAFKQNGKEEIEIVDIIRLMYAFNLKKFPTHHQVGVSAYTSSKAVLNDFLAESEAADPVGKGKGKGEINEYEKIAKILPDIIKLYELIEKEAGVKYKEAVKNGKYGGIKGVDGTEGGKTHQSKFYGVPIDFRSPIGFIFPIISSFKALVDRDKDGTYTWICNPEQAWKENGASLMEATVERSTSLGSNPQSTGKDSGLWKQNLSVNYIAALTAKAKRF